MIAAWLLIAAGILMLTATNGQSLALVRVVLAMLMLVILPGAVLTRFVFGREPLDAAERMLLIVALSLSSVILLGLIIHLSPWGFDTSRAWILLLLGLITEATLIVITCRLYDVRPALPRLSPGLDGFQFMWLLLAAVMAVIALRFASLPVSPEGLEGYSLLWVREADIPGQLAIGVESEEFAETQYRLAYDYNGARREISPFTLEPGEVWQGGVQLDPQAAAGSPITVELYRQDTPGQVYRRVTWWPHPVEE